MVKLTFAIIKIENRSELFSNVSNCTSNQIKSNASNLIPRDHPLTTHATRGKDVIQNGYNSVHGEGCHTKNNILIKGDSKLLSE